MAGGREVNDIESAIPADAFQVWQTHQNGDQELENLGLQTVVARLLVQQCSIKAPDQALMLRILTQQDEQGMLSVIELSRIGAHGSS